MTEDEDPTELSEESRPDRQATPGGDSQHAVIVDREIWEHFGSEDRILEVLRLLVNIAKNRST